MVVDFCLFFCKWKLKRTWVSVAEQLLKNILVKILSGSNLGSCIHEALITLRIYIIYAGNVAYTVLSQFPTSAFHGQLILHIGPSCVNEL